MAYDTPGRRLILYGGVRNGSNVPLTDLWSWDGTAWTRLSEDAPLAGGALGAVVYASAADIFGVSSAGQVSRLSGAQWTSVNGSITPARGLAAFAYDLGRGRLVRFGGEAAAGQPTRETWEFDGASWSLVSSEGPPARIEHAMAYDAARGVTVLFGGVNPSNQRLNDTWEWNGREWREVIGPAPSARLAAAMVFNGAGSEILLFGGAESGGEVNDLWRRTGGGWTRVATSGGPSPRQMALMAYDAARSVVVLFGGDTIPGSGSGELWTWDGQSWTMR